MEGRTQDTAFHGVSSCIFYFFFLLLLVLVLVLAIIAPPRRRPFRFLGGRGVLSPSSRLSQYPASYCSAV